MSDISRSLSVRDIKALDRTGDECASLGGGDTFSPVSLLRDWTSRAVAQRA